MVGAAIRLQPGSGRDRGRSMTRPVRPALPAPGRRGSEHRHLGVPRRPGRSAARSASRRTPLATTKTARASSAAASTWSVMPLILLGARRSVAASARDRGTAYRARVSPTALPRSSGPRRRVEGVVPVRRDAVRRAPAALSGDQGNLALCIGYGTSEACRSAAFAAGRAPITGLTAGALIGGFGSPASRWPPVCWSRCCVRSGKSHHAVAFAGALLFTAGFAERDHRRSPRTRTVCGRSRNYGRSINSLLAAVWSAGALSWAAWSAQAPSPSKCRGTTGGDELLLVRWSHCLVRVSILACPAPDERRAAARFRWWPDAGPTARTWHGDRLALALLAIICRAPPVGDASAAPGRTLYLRRHPAGP